VSVKAQSSAFKFFNTLSRTLNVPVHCLLGNHDMNLKHSHSVSSLDAIELDGVKSQRIHLYRQMELVKLRDIHALMIPYYENQQTIEDYIKQLEKERGTEWTKHNVVAFGHLALNGAFQHSKHFNKFSGPTSSLVFQNLRKTFSGHFHVTIAT
jgi:hypothetical protein